ncbi:MAG: peptidoglycan-binding domain-containing protein [Calothrix sp. MO_167.B42]|nr:peptidoglycan-binding domain-containing protein [Calothrix sp. MO_167.B42]
MKLENITNRLSEAQVKADYELVIQIQIRLRGLGLYPGGRFIDGDFGPRSRRGVKDFCDAVGLPFPQYDQTFARKLLETRYLPSRLAMTNSNREQIFNNLLSIAQGTKLSSSELAPFLHRGLKNSKYAAEISQYPQRVAKKYNSSDSPSPYQPYPQRGIIPTIDREGLNFLHSDIKEACICIGNFVNGEIQARWLGKNALAERQFWSSTKIIPILNVVCDANTNFPNIDIANCYINQNIYQFTDIILDILTYQGKLVSSNSAAATLKLFCTPTSLENWLKNITGNQQLNFRSGYGENPFIRQPELIDRLSGKKVLDPPFNSLEIDKNYISAYDLTRIISMVGWHLHLPENARLPGANWQSLQSIITTMGHDRARYVEVAIETLGLEYAIASPVILSKLGNGYSNTRGTNEITYVAFTQFLDERNIDNNEDSKFRTLAMTLRAMVPPSQTFVEVDARMAAEVTEIIRRLIVNQLV